MVLTTTRPPAAGVYWYAAIYAAATITASAQYGARTIPLAHADIGVKAQYRGMPPQSGVIRVSARYFAAPGTEATEEAAITLNASYIGGIVQTVSARLAVTASYTGAGTRVELLSLPAQLNVAVTRAATI